jgi:hypothetical protein
MSKTIKPQGNVEHQAVDWIMKLIHCFRSSRKFEFREIHRLFFGNNLPGLEEEKELVWKIIDLLHASNPEVSPRLIFTLLVSELVGIVVFNPYTPMTDDEFSRLATAKINILINYSSEREIDIPLVNLSVDGEPVKFGKVWFHPITEADHEGEWWEKIKLNYSGNPDVEVGTYARVLSPGDREIAMEYAKDAVEEVLLIIRGVGFPFSTDDLNQFGIINEFPVAANQPYRLNKPTESIPIERTSRVITHLGPGIQVYRLNADLLNNVDENVIIILNELLRQENDKPISRMQTKFLSGLRWLGEATKPDELPARYLKISTGLEFLIGGESSKEFQTKPSITAALAERAALLVGGSDNNQAFIENEVKKYYQLRSKIVHGHGDAIKQNDFVEFGSLVRQIALAMSLMVSNFSEINDLQKWVLQQRYA